MSLTYGKNRLPQRPVRPFYGRMAGFPHNSTNKVFQKFPQAGK